MRQLTKAAHQARRYVTSSTAGRNALNAFITQPPTPITSVNNGPLRDHTIAIKDNISTSSLPTTCGSPGLRSYKPPYNATVVDQLLAAGAIIAGKTNLDEFGMGSHSLHSHFGPVMTDSGHSAGGSSGGSAVAVASGDTTSALGTDTGGSVRLPAAWNGIVGFKPSYGRVSRWGVVAYANSLDTVGFMAGDVKDVRALFEVCDEYDAKDPTSLSVSTRSRIDEALHRRGRGQRLKIGVPREWNVAELTPQWRQLWEQTLSKLQDQGHSIHAVSLPHTKHALSAYYVLAPAEASSNLAKFDGVRYGSASPPSDSSTASTEELSAPSPNPSTPELTPDTSPSRSSQPQRPGNTLYTAVRASFFGPEVQRRILLGAYTLSAEAKDNYFIRAQKMRRLVVGDFNAIFTLPDPLRSHTSTDTSSDDSSEGVEGVDVLITPTTSGPPPLLEELEKEVQADPTKQFTTDVFTVPASLAGLPAVSVPGIEEWGTQVIGQFGDDEAVLRAAEAVEGLR